MKNGVVRWFNQEKGYGFLTGENGEDVHLHIKCGPKDAKPPKGGDNILYEEATGEKGLWAKSWCVADEQPEKSTAIRPPVGPVWDTRGIHPARQRRGRSRASSVR